MLADNSPPQSNIVNRSESQSSGCSATNTPPATNHPETGETSSSGDGSMQMHEWNVQPKDSEEELAVLTMEVKSEQKEAAEAMFVSESPLSRVSFGPAATRRLEAMSHLSSAGYQKYNWEQKFTLYSPRTDILQSDSFDGILAEASINDLLKEGQFWIDVTRPSNSDFGLLAQAFSIHPLTIEDIQVRENREKCEVFEKYTFLCIRTCCNHAEQETPIDSIINLYLIMFSDYIVSIHAEPLPHIRHVLRRIFPLRPVFDITPDWIMYSLLDDVVDEFMPGIRTMEMETDSIDDLVLVLSQSDQSDMLRRIGRARKRVTFLQRLLKPKTEIVKTLTKRCPERLKPQTLLYMRDIQDHVMTMVSNIDHFGETLNRSHSNYLAQISIELNEASNRMSDVMKKLTVAASILVPLSLISGMWGMNVPVPFTNEFAVNPYPFVLISFIMAVIALGMCWIGKKNSWF